MVMAGSWRSNSGSFPKSNVKSLVEQIHPHNGHNEDGHFTVRTRRSNISEWKGHYTRGILSDSLLPFNAWNRLAWYGHPNLNSDIYRTYRELSKR